VRTAIGPVKLGHQRQGTVRKLTQHEIGDLHALVAKPA
jgi:16S rRNA U516 pseudouridylate synthase RsuA-like enzyme